ncbi:MAG: hypothetical protein HIU86_05005 [Acidobacteria bacterium]|nr:hypothetical protein [Acidobacteriota bacterium]
MSSTEPLGDAPTMRHRPFIAIDDDPTGSQSVAGVPVLTAWRQQDLTWALQQRAPVVFVLTNGRSVGADEAARRVRQVVAGALAAADSLGQAEPTFLSRGDSTLRGHFPEEPEAVQDALRAAGRPLARSIVLVPAFPAAGRITRGGVHLVRAGDRDVPVGETEYARDASFGFRSSALPDWVAEKTLGRIPAGAVAVLDLRTLRRGVDTAADWLVACSAPVIAADAETDDDLRLLAAASLEAEARGARLLFRTGPAFVGARIGQQGRTSVPADDVLGDPAGRTRGGLVVVGSHVPLTTRQLAVLRSTHRLAADLELVVDRIDDAASLAALADEVARALPRGDVLVSTSRTLSLGADAGSSLRIARGVSDALASTVRSAIRSARPRFVVGKGGITSHDVAMTGLGMTRGTIVGPMLDGVVSAWRPADGPAAGVPYIVFPGNVGSDDALRTVVRRLSADALPTERTTP